MYLCRPTCSCILFYPSWFNTTRMDLCSYYYLYSNCYCSVNQEDFLSKDCNHKGNK
nr:MAG TPA: hypothetical protein [Caudoviricetes sp.]